MSHWFTFDTAKVDAISLLTTIFAIVGFGLSIYNVWKARGRYRVGVIITREDSGIVKNDESNDPRGKPHHWSMSATITNLGNQTFTITDLWFTVGRGTTKHSIANSPITTKYKMSNIPEMPITLQVGEGFEVKVGYTGWDRPTSLFVKIHDRSTWEKPLDEVENMTHGSKHYKAL